MQTQELRQRFEHAESTIAELARTCSSHQNVPNALKQSIQELDQQARECHSRVQGGNEQTFIDAVDKLEACSDHAKMACQNTEKVDQTVQSAVMRTHQELSQLKHSLH